MATLSTNAPIIRVMLWGIIIIIFAFDFFHTAIGLKETRPLNLEWGSWIIAVLVFAGLVVFATFASAKNKVGWGLYLCFAFFAFICNFNVFYPNQMGRELLQAEITDKGERLTALLETTRERFRDTTQEAFINSVQSKIGELEASIKNDASGRRLIPILTELNQKLGSSIKRIKMAEDNNTPAARALLAEDYRALANTALDGVLAKSGYLPRMQILRRGDTLSQLFPQRIEAALAELAIDTVSDFSGHAQLVVELTTAHNTLCAQASRVDAGIACANILAENHTIRTLSHTLGSMFSNFWKGGTLTALLIAFFMNFVFPIAKKSQLARKREDIFIHREMGYL